ncbi:hypothetical protein CBOM_01926 [Ceraceosorus bombacis]|uniref:Uncharacterized protein n=1 Tax=Ceraceosorus bombacis TaxID=401625 RepID=A0A0P1BDS3_9BASI|nr:hypothetical protein CBOM_01926 [Ceraceosorus bombacis]
MLPNEALAIMNKHIDVMKGIAMRLDESLSAAGKMYSVADLREKANAAIAAKNEALVSILDGDLRIIFGRAITQTWLPDMLNLIRAKKRGEHELTVATFRNADNLDPRPAVLRAVGGSGGAASESESASSRATSATPACAATASFYDGLMDNQGQLDTLESHQEHNDTFESANQGNDSQASTQPAIAPHLPSASGHQLPRSLSTAACTTGDDIHNERAHISKIVQLMRETLKAEAVQRKADEERRKEDIAREAIECQRDCKLFAATMLQAVRMLPSEPGSCAPSVPARSQATATPNDAMLPPFPGRRVLASEEERQKVERSHWLQRGASTALATPDDDVNRNDNVNRDDDKNRDDDANRNDDANRDDNTNRDRDA